MFQKIVKALGGDPQKREIERMYGVVEQINSLEPKYEKLSDAELRALTDDFRARIADAVEDIEDEKERRQVEQDTLNEIVVQLGLESPAPAAPPPSPASARRQEILEQLNAGQLTVAEAAARLEELKNKP